VSLNFFREEVKPMIAQKFKCQGLVEYAFILILVAFIIMVGVFLFGGIVANLYRTVIANI
jgi:hypothetical protein